MRYILDDSGYIDSVSCTPFNCKDKSCQEYTGTIPSGYETLAEWAQNANIRAYKLVAGNLTYDEAKAAELEAEWEIAANGITTGQEVATNEFIDGKRVYVKRVSCGALPNAGQKTIEHGLDYANITIIEFKGIAKYNNIYIPLPTIDAKTANYNIQVYIHTNRIIINTSDNKSNYTESYVTIKYIKNE